MDPTTVIDVVKTSDDEDEVDARRDALPPAELVLNLGEFETLAREVLGEDSRAWRYFSSFADDGACESMPRCLDACSAIEGHPPPPPTRDLPSLQLDQEFLPIPPLHAQNQRPCRRDRSFDDLLQDQDAFPGLHGSDGTDEKWASRGRTQVSSSIPFNFEVFFFNSSSH